MGIKSTLIVAASLVFALTSHAHHGFAVHYDVATQVRIVGTIHGVKFRNPHSEISVLVTEENGDTAIWSCETQASSILTRKGITADRFPVGEPIVIEGSKARRHATRCEIGTAYLPDGSSVTLRTVQGRANIAVNNLSAADKTNSTVFGFWIRDSFAGEPVTPGFLDLITAAGREANTAYDGSRDDPTLNCSPANPVRAWVAPGSPTEIRDEGDRILIRHEFMDTSRIVHMNEDDVPEGAAPSEMGSSTGRIDHDELVVETRNFKRGVLLTHVGDSGVLHSDKMRLVERYSVNSETGQLEFRWEATDVEYFGGVISGQLNLSPTTLPVGTYDCVIQTGD